MKIRRSGGVKKKKKETLLLKAKSDNHQKGDTNGF